MDAIGEFGLESPSIVVETVALEGGIVVVVTAASAKRIFCGFGDALELAGLGIGDVPLVFWIWFAFAPASRSALLDFYSFGAASMGC